MTMKQFTKAVCVVDTCSIINLDEITLGRKDVLRYIRCDFDVQFSSIIADEFARHNDKVHSTEASYWSSFLNSRSRDAVKLHDDAAALSVFHTTAPVFGGSNNAGEYGNARLAMELLMSRSVGQVIFVSDDEKARRAFLASLCQSFPGVTLWTSLDVIFYVASILMGSGCIVVEDVEAALRDLVAAAGKWPNLPQDVQSELAKRRADAKKRLQRLESVVKVWRKEHV